MAITNQRSQRGSKKQTMTSTTVPKAVVEHAHLSLVELAQKPKDNVLLREAVEQTLDAIAEILAKGYSPEEVAALMRKNGFNLNLSKLPQSGTNSINRKSSKEQTPQSSARRRTTNTATASARRKK